MDQPDFEDLPSWNEDPNVRFHFFDKGGTSCMTIRGEEDGTDFTKQMIAVHISGKVVEFQNEVESNSKLIVAFDIESADFLYEHLGKTIRDFKSHQQ